MNPTLFAYIWSQRPKQNTAAVSKRLGDHLEIARALEAESAELVAIAERLQDLADLVRELR